MKWRFWSFVSLAKFVFTLPANIRQVRNWSFPYCGLRSGWKA